MNVFGARGEERQSCFASPGSKHMRLNSWAPYLSRRSNNKGQEGKQGLSGEGNLRLLDISMHGIIARALLKTL